MVFYMKGKRVVGVVLWNIFNRMPIARKVSFRIFFIKTKRASATNSVDFCWLVLNKYNRKIKLNQIISGSFSKDGVKFFKMAGHCE